MNNTEEEISAQVRNPRGLEDTLDICASALLMLGIIGAVVLLILGSVVWSFLPAIGLAGGIGLAGSSWFAWLVLRGLAEIVRLQKRANDLPYSGKISQTEKGDAKRCDSCGQILEGTSFCDTCQQSVAGAE